MNRKLRRTEAKRIRSGLQQTPAAVQGMIADAVQHYQARRLDEALACFRGAIALKSDNAEAHLGIGIVLYEQGQPEAAMASYQSAIILKPDSADAHNSLGTLLQEQARLDEAVASYQSAITLKPDFAVAHSNLGGVLQAQGRLDEAVISCRQAIVLKPTLAEAHSNLGGALKEQGRLDEAVISCRQAIVLKPTLAEAHSNLGYALQAQGRLDEAVASYYRAIDLKPDFADAHHNLALALLAQGNLAAGWKENEWRWKTPQLIAQRRNFSQPQWRGEAAEGQMLLIHAEHGLGDNLQLCRYASLAAARGLRVIMEVPLTLMRLLRGLPGVDTWVATGDELPPFDLHCPMLSLPLALGTTLATIPSTTSYLHADLAQAEVWRARLAGMAKQGPRIGLVWAGTASTKVDRQRSLDPARLAPLFELSGLHFFSLQKGGPAAPKEFPLTDFMEEMGDFADTAALIANLDLVISVDTAVVHLAAALGKPVWMLDRFNSDWRWLVGRYDSPWYPTLRIYRQLYPGDWNPVIADVVSDLRSLAGNQQVLPLNKVTFSEISEEANLPMNRKQHRTESKHGISVLQETEPAAHEVAMSTHQMSGLQTGGFNEFALCRSGLMLYNQNDQYVGASLRKYGEFSGEETALFRQIVKPNMTVLEIGANIGAHTIDLSRLVAPAGVVHAFEPQRLTFQVLCANVAVNSCRNVFTYQAAVGAVSGTLLVPSLDPGASNNFGGLSLLGAQQGEPVPLITVDGLGLSACHFIKLDVEGMETEALQGAAATIERFRPLLYVENDRDTNSAKLIGLLLSYRYRIYWHITPLYNANNFRNDPENIFGNIASINMICVAEEVKQSITDFLEVTSPGDSWRPK